MRRGYWFVPKHMFGKPTDVFAHGGPHLPLRLEQMMLTLVLKLLVGDVTNYGLPAPDHRVLESHPLMNTQVLHHMGHGDVVARPDIAELRGDTVAFGDGTEEPYDLIIWATGYEVAIPFLDRDLFTWQGARPDLYLHQFHRDRDDLSVMGLFEVDGGAYPILSLQGRLLVQAVEAQRSDPEPARRWRALKRLIPTSRAARATSTPRATTSRSRTTPTAATSTSSSTRSRAAACAAPAAPQPPPRVGAMAKHRADDASTEGMRGSGYYDGAGSGPSPHPGWI